MNPVTETAPSQALATSTPEAERIPRSVWICALLSAAARFAPLPFLDDLLIGRIQRHLVATILARHNRSFDRRQVAGLYEDPGSCLSGCLSALWRVPLTLLLFPIRRIWGIIKAIRNFSKAIAHTLLLARSIERSLDSNLMVNDSPPALLAAQATAVRLAHFQALGSTDVELLKSTLGQVSRRTGIPRLALRLLKRVRRQDREVEAPEKLMDSEPGLDEQVRALDQALEGEELQAMFVAFDQRFDQALAGTTPPS